jgi:hypothetical protein
MTALTVAERLHIGAKLDPQSGCLVWTGARNSRGYSLISVAGKVQLAHRVSYETFIGPIPAGLTIDHVATRGCVHKDCINPLHLEAVTDLENKRRAPQATKTHCVHDHPLTGDNLIVKKRPSGRTIRNCRTCANDRARSRRLAAQEQATTRGQAAS